MNDELPDISRLASLLADPSRARMLLSLMGGRMLPASDLAQAASLSAQGASNHLTRLLDGGVVKVENRGRYRYYALAGPQIAGAIEALLVAAHGRDLLKPTVRPKSNAQIRFSRTCYDHLAGKVGVVICDALQSSGFLIRIGTQEFSVTEAGATWFLSALQIDVGSIRATRRPLARACLDWSERRDHLAGVLGDLLCSAFLEKNLMQRHPETRALKLTADGQKFLHQQLGISNDKWL